MSDETKSNRKTRYWVGTVFQADFDHPEEFIDCIANNQRVRRCAGQIERCPDTSRLHWQLYIELKNGCRLDTIKSIANGHWEPRKGSRDEAYAYCTKEASREKGPYERGRWDVRAGHRSDLESIRERIVEGASSIDIANEHFGSWVRYHKSFEYYRLLMSTKRSWPMDVWVLWGDTGVGKTRMVYEKAEEWSERVYALPCNSGSGIPWFDGYSGEEIILIDDFYGNIKISFLLKLLDRYPMQVQIKGSMVPFVSKRVFFTSNKKIDEWYDWVKIGDRVKAAFIRRINHKLHLS